MDELTTFRQLYGQNNSTSVARPFGLLDSSQLAANGRLNTILWNHEDKSEDTPLLTEELQCLVSHFNTFKQSSLSKSENKQSSKDHDHSKTTDDSDNKDKSMNKSDPFYFIKNVSQIKTKPSVIVIAFENVDSTILGLFNQLLIQCRDTIRMLSIAIFCTDSDQTKPLSVHLLEMYSIIRQLPRLESVQIAFDDGDNIPKECIDYYHHFTRIDSSQKNIILFPSITSIAIQLSEIFFKSKGINDNIVAFLKLISKTVSTISLKFDSRHCTPDKQRPATVAILNTLLNYEFPNITSLSIAPNLIDFSNSKRAIADILRKFSQLSTIDFRFQTLTDRDLVFLCDTICDNPISLNLCVFSVHISAEFGDNIDIESFDRKMAHFGNASVTAVGKLIEFAPYLSELQLNCWRGVDPKKFEELTTVISHYGRDIIRLSLDRLQMNLGILLSIRNHLLWSSYLFITNMAVQLSAIDGNLSAQKRYQSGQLKDTNFEYQWLRLVKPNFDIITTDQTLVINNRLELAMDQLCNAMFANQRTFDKYYSAVLQSFKDGQTVNEWYCETDEVITIILGYLFDDCRLEVLLSINGAIQFNNNYGRQFRDECAKRSEKWIKPRKMKFNVRDQFSSMSRRPLSPRS